MNAKNRLSESALKIAYGYRKDGSATTIEVPRAKNRRKKPRRKGK